MDPRLPFDADPSPAHGEPAQTPRVRRRLRSRQEARAHRRTVITYALLGGSFILMVNALVGENGYLASVRTTKEYERVTSDLRLVQDDNARLSDAIQRLKHDPEALEEAARGNLDLIRPGETLVIIREARPPQPQPSPPAPPSGR